MDLLCDLIGSLLYAMGLYTFAKMADFAPGGVSGLALIANYLWDLPIGIMIQRKGREAIICPR